jgi:hypothetical protein
MNVPQQVFTIFYAIFYGAMANALPRWKAFAWGARRSDPPSGRRAWLSMGILNVGPALMFVIFLMLLAGPDWDLQRWNLRASVLIIGSLAPSLSNFGFYKIWVAAVEWKSQYFYGDGDYFKEAVRPFLGPEALKATYAAGNCLSGVLYILVPLVLAVGMPYVAACF